MISVITPSYNQGGFIKSTIESVLSQDVPNLEYIVMDGGSTDNTVSILEEYADKIIWESKPDKGQADAVNQGIKKSNGDIIGWLNSDDIYYPDALKTVEKIFNENPDITVIYGNANHIDIGGGFIEEYYTEDYDYNRLKQICFICQPSLFFRKGLVDKHGYLNIALQYCMDYEYWLRLGKSEKFMHVNQLFAGSRLYSDNKTLGSRLKVHQEMIRMLKQKFFIIPEKWIYNLAHVICDEQSIPRETDGRTNPAFANTLANESIKLFIKYQGFVPPKAIKTLWDWKRYARKG